MVDNSWIGVYIRDKSKKIFSYIATQRIRNGEAGSKNSEIPVIAMTAPALREFKKDCFNSGMNDFISKPENFYELGLILKKYCFSSQVYVNSSATKLFFKKYFSVNN